MKLGLSIGYSGAELTVPVDGAARRDLGLRFGMTAEAYGSDAVTPLAFLAGKPAHQARHRHYAIGRRSPANAAMSAATVDALAGGGASLPASGCRVPKSSRVGTASPGGDPTGASRTTSPLCAKSSSARVRSPMREGSAFPIRGPERWGSATAQVDPAMRPDIPIYLGTGNETTVKLTPRSPTVGCRSVSWPDRCQSTGTGSRKAFAAATASELQKLRNPGLRPR